MTKFVEPSPGPAIWQGVFASWKEACHAADSVEATFAGDRWLQRMTEQLRDYRSAQCGGVAPPPRPTNLPWLAAMTSPHCIVDFGGASGWCFDYLVNVIPSLSMASYIVVETPRVVAFMQASGLQEAPVTFVEAGQAHGRCDILYCNSVLQYFPTNAPVIDLIARTQPSHVLLDDLLAAPDDDWFSTQCNYDVTIPHRFIGLNRILRDLDEVGYDLRLCAPHQSPIRGLVGALPMTNLPAALRIRQASSVWLTSRDLRGAVEFNQ